MKIAIAGGTGLIGSALAKDLVKDGHEVLILTRSPRKSKHPSIRFLEWLNGNEIVMDLEGTEVFINLAGKTINTRWTQQAKIQIKSSRIEAAEAVLDLIASLKTKPKLLINASAVGFYGVSQEKSFTETDSPVGQDFLADTVGDWEKTALKAKDMGVRTVLCRFGIVLNETEGALPRMVMPYRFFAGGKVGSGRQWVSWIHIEDTVRAIRFIMENDDIEGPVNFTAPEPVTMDEFGKTIGVVLNRPHWMPVPGLALKLLLGEMSFLVLQGQRAIPKKLIDTGFQFQYPSLKLALEQIYQ